MIKSRTIPQITKLQLRFKSTRTACVNALREELQKIDPALYLNLMRSHYGYLATLLEEGTADYKKVNPGPFKKKQ